MIIMILIVNKSVIIMAVLSFCCNIQMAGSEFCINIMKARIDPALYQQFRLMVVMYWCGGYFLYRHFGLLISNHHHLIQTKDT